MDDIERPNMTARSTNNGLSILPPNPQPDRSTDDETLQRQLSSEEDAALQLTLHMSRINDASWTQSDTESIKENIDILHAFVYIYVNDINSNRASVFYEFICRSNRVVDYSRICEKFNSKICHNTTEIRGLHSRAVDWTYVLSAKTQLERGSAKLHSHIENGDAFNPELFELNDDSNNILNLINELSPFPSDTSNNCEPTDTPRTESKVYNNIYESIVENLKSDNFTQTLEAILRLTRLCNEAGSSRDIVFEEMSNNNILQVLLNQFTKFSQERWQDIELQASKIISILVIFERDYHKLMRKAGSILSIFYMIQILEKSKSDFDQLLSGNVFGMDTNLRGSNASPTNQHVALFLDPISTGNTSASDRFHDERSRQQVHMFAYLDNYQQRMEARVLMSSALSKLSLVVCKELNDYVEHIRLSQEHLQNNASLNHLNSQNSPSFSSHNSSRSNMSPFNPSNNESNTFRPSENADERPTFYETTSNIVDVILSLLNIIFDLVHDSNMDECILNMYSLQDYPLSQLHEAPSLFLGGNSPTSRDRTRSEDESSKRRSWSIESDGFSIKNLSSYYEMHCTLLPLDLETTRADCSIVLCSIALSNLAEVSYFHPILISCRLQTNDGTLNLLKQWMEIGAHKVGNQLLQIEKSHLDINLFHEESSVYLLMYHTVKAIMLFVGGSECTGYYNGGIDSIRPQVADDQYFMASLSSNRPVDTMNNVDDPDEENSSSSFDAVSAESIHSSIITSGIAKSLIDFLHQTNELNSFTSLDVRTERIPLPRKLYMHLTQIFFQLSVHPVNRSKLQSMSLPIVLCKAFNGIVMDNKLTNRSMKYSMIKQPHHAREMSDLSSSNYNDSSTIYEEEYPEKGMNADIDGDEFKLSSYESSSISLSLDTIAFFVSDAATSAAMAASLKRETVESQNGVGPVPETCIRMPSTASGNDEWSSQPASDHDKLLVQQICDKTFIESLKTITSLAPRSLVRLSCLRFILILTEWHSCVAAVADSDIPLILVKICSEADHLQQQRSKSYRNEGNSYDAMGRNSHSNAIDMPVLQRYTSDPRSSSDLMGSSLTGTVFSHGMNLLTPNHRTNSHGSIDIGSSHGSIRSGVEPPIMSSFSSPREGHMSGIVDDFRNTINSTLSAGRSTLQSVVGNDSFFGYQDEVAAKIAKYDIVKTDPLNSDSGTSEDIFIAVYCIANIIAKKEYAELLLRGGFLEIALSLLDDRNTEICRYATRCISLLSPVIATLPTRMISRSTSNTSTDTPQDDNATSDYLELRRNSQIDRKLKYCQDVVNGCNKILNHPTLIRAAKKEALRGLAAIAKNKDELEDIVKEAIVFGPLYQVVTLLIDPERSDRDFLATAEDVLRNVGFDGGMEDLRLCSFSSDILSDMFMLKRSLKPQLQSFTILSTWIDDIFYNDDIGRTNTKVKAGYTKHQNGSSSPTISIPRTHSFDIDLAVRTASILRMSVLDNFPHAANSSSNTRGSVTPTKSLKKKVHSLLKAFPFCLGIASPHDTLKQDDEEHYSHSNKSSFDASVSPFIERPSLNDRSKTVNFNPNTVTASSSSSQKNTIDYLDHIPRAVTDLHDFFVIPKLQQLWLTDFASIGMIDLSDTLIPRTDVIQATAVSNTITPIDSHRVTAVPVAVPVTRQDHIPISSSYTFIIPKAHHIKTILMPPRMYSSQILERYSRFVEKIIQNEGSDNSWSICFRDSEFYGEFAVDEILALLGRHPRIMSLSFTGTKLETEMTLGHIVGHLPMNIRFVSFRGCISPESIQLMCAVLRKQNSALTSMSPKDSEAIGNAVITSLIHEANKNGERVPRSRRKNGHSFSRSPLEEVARSRRLKGLLGLSITFSSLQATAMISLIELLRAFKPSPLLSQTSYSSSHDRGTKQSQSIQQPGHACVHYQGLRYLDLSYNNLSEVDCVNILYASAEGPLEGLDLSGNNINKAEEFVKAVDKVLANALYAFDSIPFNHLNISSHGNGSHHHSSSFINSWRGATTKASEVTTFLRHLNLSHTRLSASGFCSLLNSLKYNHSLCTLDFSNNDFQKDDPKSLSQVKTSINTFLVTNRCVRVLDLSYMNLQHDVIKQILIGVAENDVILLITLAGNAVSEASQTIQLIQSKLSANRQQYVRTGDTRETQPFDDPVLATETIHHAVIEPIDDAKSVMTDRSTSSHGTLEKYIEPHKQLENSNETNTLYVMFSAPLVWKDTYDEYHPLEILDYMRERECIVQVFREVNRDLSVRFDFATTDSLTTALSLNCRALHFSGHGHRLFLNFEDGNGGLQLIRNEQLKELLKPLKSLQFVFVSACHSLNTGQAFVDAGVPHVVCCKIDEMIQDKSATSFTRAFYIALLSGKTVQQSFDIAKRFLQISPNIPDNAIEGEKFILLPNDSSISHERVIFSSPVVTNWPISGKRHIQGRGFTASSWLVSHDESGNILPDKYQDHSDETLTFLHTIPSPNPDFEGREVDMYRLITNITSQRNRHVTLVGDYGVGKSALTTATCNYIADRGMFEDGVLFVRIPASSTYENFLIILLQAITIDSHSEKLLKRLRSLLKGMVDLEKSSGRQLMTGTDDMASLVRSSGEKKDYNHEIITKDLSSEIKSLLNELNDSNDPNELKTRRREELLLRCFGPMRLLLVVDNIDNILPKNDDIAIKELKGFLHRLYDSCRFIKMLVTSTNTLYNYGVKDFIVMETTISIGALTLRSSLRLFAKLSPSLNTAKDKTKFINTLLPKNQFDVTISSHALNFYGAKIFAMVGDGHPSKIVRLALQSTKESIDQMMNNGRQILSQQINSSSNLITRGPSTVTASNMTATGLAATSTIMAASQVMDGALSIQTRQMMPSGTMTINETMSVPFQTMASFENLSPRRSHSQNSNHSSRSTYLGISSSNLIPSTTNRSPIQSRTSRRPSMSLPINTNRHSLSNNQSDNSLQVNQLQMQLMHLYRDTQSSEKVTNDVEMTENPSKSTTSSQNESNGSHHDNHSNTSSQGPVTVLSLANITNSDLELMNSNSKQSSQSQTKSPRLTPADLISGWM